MGRAGTNAAWLVAGRPKHNGKKLGGFESWTDVVGGILGQADIPDSWATWMTSIPTPTQNVVAGPCSSRNGGNAGKAMKSASPKSFH